jgi:hypothetical protein
MDLADMVLEPIDCPPRVAERPQAGRLQAVVAPGPPASRRRALAQTRTDEALGLQPVERRVDGAGRHAARQPGLDVDKNRAPVGLFAKVRDWRGQRQKHRLLEDTEDVRHLSTM